MSTKPIAYMALASLISWLGAAVVVDRRTSIEILFGMLGPLAAASATWFLASWVYKEHPAGLMALLGAAFVLKMGFFGGYVTLMLRIVGFRTVPFVASFTGYFVGLYLIEALYLRRLFSQRSR
jgi:hypothetical protein